ncbi:MAG: hypothetical protein AAB431_00585 [Patescibacteria group bacterium]
MSLKDEVKKGIACDSAGKPDSALGRAVCLSVHPGKMVLFPFRHWFNTKYKGRYKFARAMFGLDLFLMGVAVTLASVVLFTLLFLHTKFEDKITFEATVAPHEVVTGAPSTLVIRYTNGTKEELRNAELTLKAPDHFLLQTLSGQEDQVVEENRIRLGTIPVGFTGAVHVKGVMFGDVGGQQSFQSKMTFVHGKPGEEHFGTKTDTQTFSPTHSALSLSLELPERMIASQPIEGIIRYKNTGEIEFPVVSILPHWPAGFTFTSSDAKQRKGQFEIDTVKPGESGQMNFKGVLQDGDKEVTFTFEPSFTFGDDRYKQETLAHIAPIVPLPITLEHSINKQSLQPGGEVVFTVVYKNVSDQPVSDVAVGIESDSPFFKTSPVFSDAKDPGLKTIAPGESRTVEIRAQLKSSIPQSATSTYEHLTVRTRPIATYTLTDGKLASKGAFIESPLTTPIILESFARYRTASGDQLGRGPLPPQVGKETTYWIFWHVDGTTNELSNVRIEGTLPQNVRFTERQTVSQNSGVTYEAATRKISWISSSVPPTLSPTSKILGIAFEVGITPTQADLTKTPLLLKDVQVTATDAWTGAFVSAQVKNVLGVLK